MSSTYTCEYHWLELVPILTGNLYVGFAKSATVVYDTLKRHSFPNITYKAGPARSSVVEISKSEESEDPADYSNFFGPPLWACRSSELVLEPSLLGYCLGGDYCAENAPAES